MRRVNIFLMAAAIIAITHHIMKMSTDPLNSLMDAIILILITAANVQTYYEKK